MNLFVALVFVLFPFKVCLAQQPNPSHGRLILEVSKLLVLNLGYAHPRGYCKDMLGVRKI
jgi:hypothetical protein